MLIHPVDETSAAQRAAWLALRAALWPHAPGEEHAAEAAGILARPGDRAAFLARSPEGEHVAFAEAALRRDYVNGCGSPPVAFLEGIHVSPEHRGRGAARALCATVEGWATARGCSELASDADIANRPSHRMHAALGFTETERVVFFRKRLLPP